MTNIKLANVRCSYPSIFEKEKYEGNETKYYTCTFIIPKDRKKEIKQIKEAIEAAKVKAGVKKLGRLAKICFQDGDESEADEVQGCYTLKAKTKKRPPVKHNKANGSENLSADDEVIYPGCYVNGIIAGDFYCYKNNGSGVTSTLLGVQFCKDGESFEGGPSMAEDEDFEDFDDLEDDEDDDEDV